jgi:hypothetical protein
MSIQEQQHTKELYYTEAMRYMDNAKQCLQKAKKEDRYYSDSKYVKMACGTAYSGVLVALDGFFALKGVEAPKKKARKSIEYYTENVSKLDEKLLNNVNSAYQILHLSGYYDGNRNANVIKEGFDEAYHVIEKIKPAA